MGQRGRSGWWWCVVVCGAAQVLGGCVWHLDRNAPGLADVMREPAQIDSRAVEAPVDPGERVLAVYTGPLGTMGGARVDGAWQGWGRAGLEAHVRLFERDASHQEPEHSELLLAPPGSGPNLGWDVIEANLDADAPEPGSIYVEWQWDDLLLGVPSGVSVGYGVNPVTGSHGPQVSAYFLAGNYVRIMAQTEGGIFLGYGVVLKWPQAWVWSR